MSTSVVDKVCELASSKARRTRGDVVCVETSGSQTDLNLIALLYAKARALGTVKVVFKAVETEVRFFDKIVPLKTDVVDVFAVLDNQTMDIVDADVVILTAPDAVDKAQMKPIITAAHERKGVVVAFVDSTTPESLAHFGSLKPHVLLHLESSIVNGLNVNAPAISLPSSTTTTAPTMSAAVGGSKTSQAER